MSFLQILPILAYGLAVAALIQASRPGAGGSWRLAAAVGAAFTGFTLWTLWQDGASQFWFNHTVNLAGNQVWFDLLIAVTLAFALIVPRARAQAMPVLPWAIAVAATASVALLLMLARLLWLEAEARRREGVAPAKQPPV